MAGYCVTLEARSLVLQVRRPSSVARLSESALIGSGLAFRAVSAWRHQRDDAGMTMPTYVQGGRESSRCNRDLDEMTSRQSNWDCVDSDGMQQFR
jgi:hypothetical protein